MKSGICLLCFILQLAGIVPVAAGLQPKPMAGYTVGMADAGTMEKVVGVYGSGELEKSYSGRLGNIFEQFEKSPALVVILYVVIIYSIITLISLTIYILLNRSKREKEDELKSQLNEQYQHLLIEYLFEAEQRDEIFEKISRIATDKFKRQILINQIMELSINMQGDSKTELQQLFLDTGLKQDSVKKAYSKKWHENVKGFRELAFMNIRSENEHIIKCLNSHNQILRMEAQIALVRLSDDNPYTFLSFLEKPLARWEQITLHELVTQHNLQAPDFSIWFASENLTVLKFSLQMASWFKQKGAADGVIKLLRHPDMEVRSRAIRTCGELGLNDGLHVLRAIYYDEPVSLRTEILKAFGKVPDERYLDFMNEVLDTEEDVQLQILATKAMENMDEPGISRLVKLMKSKSEYKNYQIIIRHVLDGRIY
ncbi:MAG: HEAT repeat domain-containing protein [Bacteroidales bacterium]